MELAASFDAQLSSLAPFIFYIVVAGIVFIETGLLFGFFLPGDSILFSAGLVAAAHGNINIVILVTAIFLAAFFGDQVGFVIGRVVGRPYLDKKESPRMKRMIAKSEVFYEKYGWWAVVIARYFPWIRTFVPPIALGAFLWGVGITLAGFYAATVPWVKSSSYAIAAFFITASLISVLVKHQRHPQEPQDKS
jgi:membrane-associated protein